VNVAHPDVSVIIPVRDGADTIDAQLGALAAQVGAPTWELIIADNGSRDDTVARALAWREKIGEIVVVDASSRPGPSAARNEGVARARGSRLLFCDADDAAEPGWVRAMTAALEHGDAAAGSRRYDALNDRPFGPADWTEPFFRKEPLLGLVAASSHNLAVSRAAFTAVGGFDERLGASEDVDLCWRLQMAGYRMVAAPDAAMQIRRRSGVRGVFRQACAYGRGDRQLAMLYADVATDHLDAVPAPPVDGSGAPQSPPRPPLPAGRPRRIRLPDLEFHAHRWGYVFGKRFGRIDATVAPGRSSSATGI
jgi:glycosyltransferase involved in cell wall biosynthesis